MRNCSPSLSVSNASRSNCFISVLDTFLLCPFPPSAFGMTSFTIAILITQVLGYVLALVGLCLCIMGESHSFVFLIFVSVKLELLLPLPFFLIFLKKNKKQQQLSGLFFQNSCGLVEKPSGKYRDLPMPHPVSIPHPPSASLTISHQNSG